MRWNAPEDFQSCRHCLTQTPDPKVSVVNTRLGASLREQLAPRLGFSAPVQPLCTATVSVRPDVSFALPSAQPLASRAQVRYVSP